jgi:hypothetical protein
MGNVIPGHLFPVKIPWDYFGAAYPVSVGAGSQQP